MVKKKVCPLRKVGRDGRDKGKERRADRARGRGGEGRASELIC